MVWYLPNGIGQALGDKLVTGENLRLSGEVFYVHYGTGDDSAFSGHAPETPLRTLSAAHTAAAAGDIVVLMDGHDETISSTLTLSKALVIAGGGSVAGVPNARLRGDIAAANMIVVGADDITFRNIRFGLNVQANSSERIAVGFDHCSFIDCYFEQDDNDDAAMVQIAPTIVRVRFRGCTFKALGTVPTGTAS